MKLRTKKSLFSIATIVLFVFFRGKFVFISRIFFVIKILTNFGFYLPEKYSQHLKSLEEILPFLKKDRFLQISAHPDSARELRETSKKFKKYWKKNINMGFEAFVQVLKLFIDSSKPKLKEFYMQLKEVNKLYVIKDPLVSHFFGDKLLQKFFKLTSDSDLSLDNNGKISKERFEQLKSISYKMLTKRLKLVLELTKTMLKECLINSQESIAKY